MGCNTVSTAVNPEPDAEQNRQNLVDEPRDGLTTVMERSHRLDPQSKHSIVASSLLYSKCGVQISQCGDSTCDVLRSFIRDQAWLCSMTIPRQI